MSEFVFLYRLAPENTPPPQEMPDRLKRWMAWMKDLEEKGHLVSAGRPLTGGGAVVKKGRVTDGPYAETKELVIGFTIVRAADLAEASRLAEGCPIARGGGMVEVRPVASM